MWERTDEPLILSEERENEREAEFEEAAVKDSEHVVSMSTVCVWGAGKGRVCSCYAVLYYWFNQMQIPGESNQEVGLAGKKTLESVKAVSCQFCVLGEGSRRGEWQG